MSAGSRAPASRTLHAAVLAATSCGQPSGTLACWLQAQGHGRWRRTPAAPGARTAPSLRRSGDPPLGTVPRMQPCGLAVHAGLGCIRVSNSSVC